MNKPEFTPGPWVYSGRLGFGHLVSPNIAVAYGGATSGRQDSGEANARLIAAAPDMYEALQATLLFHSASPWDCEKQNRWRELTGKDEATTRALCDLVRAALAKAEGRAS